MYECRVIRKSLAVRLRRQPRLFHVDGDRGVLCQGALSFIYPGCPYSMQNFLGQGAKPRHSGNLRHSSDNTRSLTFRTSRELSGMLLMTHVSFLKMGGTPALGRLHGSSHVWDRLSCCHKPSPRRRAATVARMGAKERLFQGLGLRQLPFSCNV